MSDSQSARPFSPTQELPPGTQLGNFTVVRTLGQGGFGITYLARDAALDVDVVIKENLPLMFAHRDANTLQVHSLTKAETDGSWKWAVDNFIHEARMLARLNHPNIVKVMQVFPAYGTHCFVMPFIEGESLDTWREKNGAPAEDWLRSLLQSLLGALSYLHGREIHHRDIKPGNILMTSEGTPVLIDFGAARQRMGEKSQTVIESPGYTPFEQMKTHGNVGPWSDIYALGGTLYKLITGDTPLRNADRMARVDPHVPLAGRAELRRKYSRQLLESIDRAMAFWESERWQSAGEWSAVLGENRPIAAPAVAETRSPATVVKLPAPAKVAAPNPAADSSSATTPRRRPAWFLFACVALLTLIGCVVWWGARQNDGESRSGETSSAAEHSVLHTRSRERDRAAREAEQKRLSEQRAAREAEEKRQAEERAAREAEEKRQAEERAAREAEEKRQAEERAAREAEEKRQAEERAAREAEEKRQAEERRRSMSPQQRQDAIVSQLPFSIAHTAILEHVVFSPDGSTIATADENYGVRLWDAMTRRQIGISMPHSGSVRQLAFSPDGRKLATCAYNSNVVRIWDVATQRSHVREMRHEQGEVNKIAFSPDGRLLASCADDKYIRLWDVETGQQTGDAMRHTRTVTSIAFSPNGRMIASGGYADTIRLWDVATQKQIGKSMVHGPNDGGSIKVAFSPDGSKLASVGFENTLRLWDVASQRELARVAHDGVFGFAFSPDGKLIASCGYRGSVCLWKHPSLRRFGNNFRHGKRIDGIDEVIFSPDSRTVVTRGDMSYFKNKDEYVNTVVSLWNPSTGKQKGDTIRHENLPIKGMAFSPDGRILVTVGNDKSIRFWPVPQE